MSDTGQTGIGLPARRFFDEIVGLRIFLACWVALQHAMQSAGYQRSNPLFSFMMAGDVAVEIFIIISGFVITGLILNKREDYIPYIIRRFFRLYPVYIVGLVAGFAVALPWIDLTLSAPWQSLPNWAHYAANIQDSYRAEMSNFWPHALLHLVMLHGLVPNEILNHASEAFLPAAWSLSLEWQFYLIAPLVLAALFRRWSACLVIVVAAIGYILYSRHTLGTYSTPSTIFASSPYFAIGIASRLLVDRLSGFRIAPVLPPLLIAVVAILLRAGLGVTIWVTFYSYMLWKDRGGVDGRIFKTIFQNRASLLLGEASYSVYLLHRPIQVMTAYLIRPHSQIGMVVLMVCSLLPTFGISLLTFKIIERPGEMLGRRIASRFGKAAAPEPLPA